MYLGTPAMAVPPLRALVAAEFDLALVVSRPDRRRGRGGATSPSAVKAAAQELGLPVSDTLADATGVNADLGVVVAYGRIIPPAVLDALPMVNLHFSLLPRWRGAAPVERTLLAGDERTGVCVMAVEEGLDTGGVYARREVPIGRDDTAEDLRRRLVDVGTPLLVDTLVAGLGEPEPQHGEVTHADKIDPAELEIDWTRPRRDIERLVRLGGAWTTVRGSRLKVWAGSSDVGGEGIPVPAGDGPFELREVQPEGRSRLPAADWARGARLRPGERLGT